MATFPLHLTKRIRQAIENLFYFKFCSNLTKTFQVNLKAVLVDFTQPISVVLVQQIHFSLVLVLVLQFCHSFS